MSDWRTFPPTPDFDRHRKGLGMIAASEMRSLEPASWQRIAVVIMSAAVATWYQLSGPMTPEDVAERYLDYAPAVVDAA